MLTRTQYKQQSGFTIVELLIVIVVIGILAAITIVAYNGIQNRAYDAAVQSDIDNVVKELRLYEASNGYYPAGVGQLSTVGIKLTKTVYDPYYNGAGYYNFLYCRMPNVNPTSFSIVAYGKSGHNFQYNSGGELKAYNGGKVGSVVACADTGVPITGNERDWFYDNGSWQSFVGS
jgi:prepilin-type N-terminal cleavage/methylation domain-containing protein